MLGGRSGEKPQSLLPALHSPEVDESGGLLFSLVKSKEQSFLESVDLRELQQAGLQLLLYSFQQDCVMQPPPPPLLGFLTL